MQYTIDYFINKFSAIPEKMWTIRTRGYDDNGPHCALGHCDESWKRWGNKGAEETALIKIFDDDGLKIIRINNGDCPKYQQPTPKQRILAALHDIKKLNSEQGVKECDATMSKKDIDVGKIKTVIKYVSVPETISKSVPETILS